MTDTLAFEWDWLAPFDRGSAEGCTFADLRIRIGDRLATELEDLESQTLREGAHVSAYPLALFVAANWWRLRWEPAPTRETPEWRMRHSLAAAGEGYAWPDLTFASVGDFILATARAGAPSATAPVRYVADFAQWTRAGVFEDASRAFIDGVLARLQALDINGTELEAVWRDVCREQSDTEAARWRRLEALAGYDPDEAPEAFIADLLQASEDSGWAAIEELAAASRGRALEDLHLLREAVQQHGVRFRIADFDRLRTAVESTVTDSTLVPWQRAEHVAREARKLWGLDGKPVSTRVLAELMDMPEENLAHVSRDGVQQHVPYSASLRSADMDESLLVLNRRPATSRRFSACRLIGDRLFGQTTERLAAATNAYTGRQKFQRAFAQELLCPFDALRDFLDGDGPSDDDIEDAAEHFQVSPRLVHTTLVNHHALPRETLEELG